MNSIFISVIVPIYKVEPYIRKCLDSIVNQSYQELEILLIDDGSPDSCGAICDEYAQKDERIIVIHKKNGGISSARNAALDIATGEYVMFVDSDDWVESNFCETALRIALDNHVQIATFGYNNIFLGENNHIQRIQERHTNSPRYVNSSTAIRHIIEKDDVIFNFAWNKIYKRSLFENVRYPVGRIFEDNAVTCLLIMKAQNIYVSDEVLYNYIKRSDSITGKGISPRIIVDRFEILNNRLKDIRKCCPENEQLQIKQIANDAIEGIVRISPKSEFGYALDEFYQFLAEYKDIILSCPCSRKVKLYYYFRPFFLLYKYSRNIGLL